MTATRLEGWQGFALFNAYMDPVLPERLLDSLYVAFCVFGETEMHQVERIDFRALEKSVWEDPEYDA